MNVQIETASDGHAVELIHNGLRQMSAREMALMPARNPLQAAVEMVRQGAYVWTGRIDGRVVCMWGIQRPSLISREAYMWFVSTAEIDEHPFMVARKSKLFIDEVLARGEFEYICGVVDAEFKRSVRWLKWLGFTVLPTRPDGFRVFEMRRG